MTDKRRHELVVPISALGWDRIEDVLFPIGMIMAPVGLAVCIWAGGADMLIALPAGLALACVGAVTYFLGSSGTLRYLASRPERKAGYTTIPFPHDPDVDLVEPKTGIAIREVGAPALSKEEYEAAVRQVRAEYLA